MSPFDIAVGLAAVVAIVFGFKSGLMRSLRSFQARSCGQCSLSRHNGGLKSLPPEAASFIDQIKSRRQI